MSPLIQLSQRPNCIHHLSVRNLLIAQLAIWRPYLIQDIIKLESIQRRATKFIMNDYTSDYKSRLLHLNLLPLMYVFEITDII